MAPRPRPPIPLWALQLLVFALAAPSAFGVQLDLTGYGQLVSAIYQANENARLCGGTLGCLGDQVVVTLTSPVYLVSSLPPLAFGADLVIVGACASEKANRCPINGLKQRTIFTSTPVGGPLARLELRNLRLVNARRGVFLNVWAKIRAYNCVFSRNSGVEISLGLEGGFPKRVYQSCTFKDNSNTAIVRGSYANQVVSANRALVVQDSGFFRNRGQETGGIEDNGGAIALWGEGSARISDTIFSQNYAAGGGGAVFVNTSTALFTRVTFSNNRAGNWRGKDVLGTTGPFGNTLVSFCRSSFSRQALTLTHPLVRVFLETPDTPSGYTALRTCRTRLPKYSQLPSVDSKKGCAYCDN